MDNAPTEDLPGGASVCYNIYMNNIVLGMLAHVDAGKTTTAEAMLYKNGQIRSLGRVDHKDAFLDTGRIERQRGITIFSKQARLRLGEYKVDLLDTPGHIDFSAEIERSLWALDGAIVVVSGVLYIFSGLLIFLLLVQLFS